MHSCLRTRARARARACACACVRVHMCACVYACIRACVLCARVHAHALVRACGAPSSLTGRGRQRRAVRVAPGDGWFACRKARRVRAMRVPLSNSPNTGSANRPRVWFCARAAVRRRIPSRQTGRLCSRQCPSEPIISDDRDASAGVHHSTERPDSDSEGFFSRPFLEIGGHKSVGSLLTIRVALAPILYHSACEISSHLSFYLNLKFHPSLSGSHCLVYRVCSGGE
jgi:hypothetical protein